MKPVRLRSRSRWLHATFVVLVAALIVSVAGCKDQPPEGPRRPPPSRALLPSQRPAVGAAAIDPLAPPRTAGGRPIPRERVAADPSIGGGAIVNLVRTNNTPVYPGAPGRDLAAEVNARIGGLGLETCLARTATRTETTWELDYNNPGLQRAEVDRRAAPTEPARTVRLRATFSTTGRVSNATLSVSPSVDATAQQCMRSRIDGLALAPMQGASTVEVAFGLAPRG